MLVWEALDVEAKAHNLDHCLRVSMNQVRNIQGVFFGKIIPATIVSIDSDTQITATSPASIGDVEVFVFVATKAPLFSSMPSSLPTYKE